MSKYKLIIEYYLKGNNRTQIATLCDCSRMTVWRVLQRVNAIGIGLDELSGMSEKELAYLLFPERAKPGDGYLIPDFKWEEFQMVKHRSSIRLCWRRYCKRAAKQNLAAYSWKVFLTSYNKYRRPKIQVDDPDDKIRTKLKHYNFLLAYCESENLSSIKYSPEYMGSAIKGRKYLKELVGDEKCASVFEEGWYVGYTDDGLGSIRMKSI